VRSKLKNFPSINYPSLHECDKRRAFMQAQFKQYGIEKHNVFITDRYSQIKESYTLKSALPIETGQPGIIISFMTLLKDWYDRDEEEYAIFCDDDIDFSSIDSWTFSWDEFVAYLPDDWECVQLIRINSWIPNTYEKYDNVPEIPQLKLRERSWDDWGSSFLAKRSYVKKILDAYYLADKHYSLDIADKDWGQLYPNIENFLFRNLGKVYSFPLLLENVELGSTTQVENSQEHRLNAIQRMNSREYYDILWKDANYDLDIKTLMGRNPLDGMPTLNVISLHECASRRRNIMTTASKYNFKNTVYNINDRFSFNSGINIQCYALDVMPEAAIGVAVSHLESIRYWYEHTNEPYAIFAEDDIKLDVADLWGFTFRDFLHSLPKNWQAVQLFRIRNQESYDASEGLNFRRREWNDWGCGSFLITREYAKQILDKHIKNGIYILEMENGTHPIIENIIFTCHAGDVYNFPLFAEQIFDSPKDLWDIERGIKPDHKASSELTISLWQNNKLSLQQIMGI
jgi:hypothetical protein